MKPPLQVLGCHFGVHWSCWSCSPISGSLFRAVTVLPRRAAQKHRPRPTAPPQAKPTKNQSRKSAGGSTPLFVARALYPLIPGGGKDTRSVRGVEPYSAKAIKTVGYNAANSANRDSGTVSNSASDMHVTVVSASC